MKMIFKLVLASALAMSAVLGRTTSPISRQVMYEKEKQTVMQSDESEEIMAVNDRSSDIKYVMAIKSSSIWEDIKIRSVTINTPQGLDHTVAEKSPDQLTDQELAQLKQACHDGLKCVAVDQLMMLTQIKEPLDGGKVSVRTVITKITQVLTEYTTEYHEDVYRYETIKESDNQSKVYETVTTIVEDNEELCQIDFTPTKEESHPINGDGNTVPSADNSNSVVNYITNKNYNINNGTINTVKINKDPSEIKAVVKSPESGTNDSPDISLKIVVAPNIKQRSLDDHHLPTERTTTTTDTNSLTGGKSATKSSINDARQNRSRKNSPPSETSDRHYEPVTTTHDRPEFARSAEDNPREFVDAELFDDTNTNKYDSDRVEENNVSLQNGGKNGHAGEVDCDADIVSAGSSNHGTVNKGYVENGSINNGDMVEYNVNNGIINKGTITDSEAEKGIINVGLVNNGPVNYGSADSYTNNGKLVDVGNYDVQKYLSEIENMYSTILERLG